MKDRIRVQKTDRGWLASVPERNLAVHAETRDQAVREVREGVELVRRLAAKWDRSRSEGAV
jgi:predicted RNase H-like HicB family nuclease